MKPFLALFVLLSLQIARADETPAPALVAKIQDSQISELSGLAPSRRYPGLLYAHNDSGDKARVYLLNPKGETVAVLTLKNAYARDFEDIAVAGDYVYVGDIGDNLAWRDALQLYRFTEPKIDPSKLGQSVEVKPEAFAVRYPGAPRDAETLLAAPDGRVWILSKSQAGSSLFGTTFQKDKTKTMERVGDKISFGATGIFTKLATGGSFSPDGRKLVVTTYAQISEWKLSAPYKLSDLTTLKPVVRALPGLKQCESVCYSADGSQILVSSEGKLAPIYRFVSSY
jgi:hypothetical protein